MSNLRSNLIESENRPLMSTRLLQWQYTDTGRYTVGMELNGFTTIPCADDAYETRIYEFSDMTWAMKVGFGLIRYALDSKIKNLIKKKKK